MLFDEVENVFVLEADVKIRLQNRVEHRRVNISLSD
jgi:hypothetical protein